MIITIREIVPSIGIAKRIAGLPLALIGAIVAEEEGVAELSDMRFAGKE